MEFKICWCCDFKSKDLLPIKYKGVEFYVCVDCLLFLLRERNSKALFD